jgi:hypothetical protein
MERFAAVLLIRLESTAPRSVIIFCPTTRIHPTDRSLHILRCWRRRAHRGARCFSAREEIGRSLDSLPSVWLGSGSQRPESEQEEDAYLVPTGIAGEEKNEPMRVGEAAI